MLTELALAIFSKHGLLGLLVVAMLAGMGYFVWWQAKELEEGRDRWDTMMEYVMDLRQDCARGP